MYTVYGLGNPGAEYNGTRHNTGQFVVSKFKPGKKAKIIFVSEFMNKSGRAVKSAKNLIVVHDDLDLPLGKLKISFGRGAGGHRGVESIIRALKTKDFVRIRIGISQKRKPATEKQVIGFILGKFKPSELLILKKVAKKAAFAIDTVITDGREAAMSQFN